MLSANQIKKKSRKPKKVLIGLARLMCRQFTGLTEKPKAMQHLVTGLGKSMEEDHTHQHPLRANRKASSTIYQYTPLSFRVINSSPFILMFSSSHTSYLSSTYTSYIPKIAINVGHEKAFWRYLVVNQG